MAKLGSEEGQVLVSGLMTSLAFLKGDPQSTKVGIFTSSLIVFLQCVADEFFASFKGKRAGSHHPPPPLPPSSVVCLDTVIAVSVLVICSVSFFSYLRHSWRPSPHPTGTRELSPLRRNRVPFATPEEENVGKTYFVSSPMLNIATVASPVRTWDEAPSGSGPAETKVASTAARSAFTSVLLLALANFVVKETATKRPKYDAVKGKTDELSPDVLGKVAKKEPALTDFMNAEYKAWQGKVTAVDLQMVRDGLEYSERDRAKYRSCRVRSSWSSGPLLMNQRTFAVAGFKFKLVERVTLEMDLSFAEIE